MLDPALAGCLRGALAVLLARAAWHKAQDLPAFRDAVAAYELLPVRLAPAAAPALLGAEAVLALLLCWPPLASAAALGTATLIGVYGSAIAANLARGRRALDCGCAGPGRRQSIAEWMLLRNALWVAVAVLAALPTSDRPLVWLDVATIVAGALCLALLASALERLAAGARPAGSAA